MMLAVTATHKQVLAVMPNGWVGAPAGNSGENHRSIAGALSSHG